MCRSAADSFVVGGVNIRRFLNNVRGYQGHFVLKCFVLLFVSLLSSCLPSVSAIDKKDADFLNMVEKQSFQYFVECANTANGLVLDNASKGIKIYL